MGKGYYVITTKKTVFCDGVLPSQILQTPSLIGFCDGDQFFATAGGGSQERGLHKGFSDGKSRRNCFCDGKNIFLRRHNSVAKKLRKYVFLRR